MTITVEVAQAADRDPLEALIQLYIHDFSALFAGTARCDLGDDGRYALDSPLAAWWQVPGHVALLVRREGRLAGFAQIEGAGAADTVRRVAEFFIVRKYRRTGLGTAAAAMVFDRYPGPWQAAVMRRNTGARASWDHAISSHPRLLASQVDDVADADWDGPVFRFRIGARH
jgi:predicted acetyltransferase